MRAALCLLIALASSAVSVLGQPLHDAAAEGDLDRVLVLLEQPGIDVNQANMDGWTPLQEAAARHYEQVCKALVDAGANLDHQNKDGWTPLHEAAARGLMDTTRLLVEHGASLIIKTKDGDTALHVAASHHMAEAVKYLLANGADPNAMNNDARKPHSLAHGEAKALLLGAGKRTDL
jgi:ankyrin repeat protein